MDEFWIKWRRLTNCWTLKTRRLWPNFVRKSKIFIPFIASNLNFVRWKLFESNSITSAGFRRNFILIFTIIDISFSVQWYTKHLTSWYRMMRIYSIIQPKRIHYQSSYVEKAYTKWRLFFRKLIQAVGRFEAKQMINYKLKFFFNFVFFFDNSSEI